MARVWVHASWLNQGEVYFSIIDRKVLSLNDFTDLAVIEKRLTDFEHRYNDTAQPFKWKFTTSDLADLLERLDRHQGTDTAGPNHARAACPPTNIRARPLAAVLADSRAWPVTGGLVAEVSLVALSSTSFRRPLTSCETSLAEPGQAHSTGGRP